ncbi:hypothetical protein EV14_2617 [Prochlorococcus sp. MIT 0703]|nr:hypothetical protein EV12_2254 [Prochlorococcus sp. MIT 0701]KGG31245.1 hypothetical protein EV14_2617 [Prochlorococcus sp. MIT 0703]
MLDLNRYLSPSQQKQVFGWCVLLEEQLSLLGMHGCWLEFIGVDRKQ